MADLLPHRSTMDIFGDPVDSRPVWFKKSSFLNSDFDPESYITDLRSFVLLESLVAELCSHHTALKAELVELINRDYVDFVSVSTRFVDLDFVVARMRPPLAEFFHKVLVFRGVDNSSLKALRSGLWQRSEASKAREVLELLLDTFHVVSKVKKIIKELAVIGPDGVSVGIVSVENSGLGNDNSLQHMENGTNLREAQSILLARIANEMNRLKFYISHAKFLHGCTSLN